jgi:hypothetical protein
MISRITLHTFVVCALCGCAAGPDLADDPLRSGYYESQAAPRIYRIAVRSGLALWPSRSEVRTAWRARAEALCGSAGFREVEVIEDLQGAGGGLPYMIAMRKGYAVCRDLGLSDEAAMASIGRFPHR